MDALAAGRRIRSILDAIATSLVIVVGVTVLYRMFDDSRLMPTRTSTRPTKAAPPVPLPSQPLSFDGAPLKGNRSAKIAIIEYSDFQCPYCGQFARETLPQLDKRYFETGRVMFAFLNFPLEKIHPFALQAGEGAECARHQGKFWEMHDRMFRNQKGLDTGSLTAHARALELDMREFGKCLQGQVTERIRSDASAAARLTVSGSPTFFIGILQQDGKVKVLERLVGARPAEEFQRILDPLLGMDQSK